MVKIYTKTGDLGTTALFGGRRVDKNSVRIEAYGNVDELNSLIGVIVADHLNYSSRQSREVTTNNIKAFKESSRDARTIDSPGLKAGILSSSRVSDLIPGMNAGIFPFRIKEFGQVEKKLLRIQSELFVLGSDLATPLDVKVKIPRVNKSFVTRLEKEIDTWDKNLVPLKKFILPGGSVVGSKLHVARTVARRAERSIVELSRLDKINKNSMAYINRLSDWLFTIARYVNQLEKIKEVPWQGRG